MGDWTKLVCRSALAGLLSLVCLLSGCLNIAMHYEGEPRTYGGTVECAKVIALPFVGGTGPESCVAEAYATLSLPLFLIDLPLEAVADTITLPYDVWKGK